MVEHIECWGPEGNQAWGCDAEFHGDWDADHEALGWGFTLRNSDAQAFYACPNCKDDPGRPEGHTMEAMIENQRRLDLASIRVPAMACEIRDAILALKTAPPTKEKS